MHYQIRFPNGERVPFETLNAEAANLWGIGIARDKVKYVSPKSTEETEYNEENSWHMMIGHAITHPQIVGAGGQMQQTWDQIKQTMFNVQMAGGDIWEMEAEEIQKEIQTSVEFLMPYFHLIDDWYSKGYKPVKVK